jgi:hypothetical protein
MITKQEAINLATCNWLITSNDGTNIVATNKVTGQAFSGTQAAFYALVNDTVGAADIIYDAQGRVSIYNGWTITYSATTGQVASQSNGIRTRTFTYDAVGRYTGYVET